MRKLNIAIVHDNLTHLIDGSIISTLRFAEYLKKQGHKLIFISGKPPNNKKDIDVYNGIKTYRFVSLPLPKAHNKFLLAFPSVKKLKEIFSKEKIDLVHVMIPCPSTSVAIKAAKSLGIKVIAHSHSQPENLFLYLPKPLRKKRIINLYYRYILWTYRKADLTICPSKFSESILKEWEPSLKTVVISNGVNLSRFKKLHKNKFLTKYKISKKHKRILYVGRIDPEKCIDTLIHAFPIIHSKFKNVEIDIVGSGNLHKHMEDLTHKIGLQNNIKFYGKIPEIDLVSAYNSADIFVLPSIAELEGMVILEAMACGKPILVANSPDSASIHFVDGNGFLFKPNDSEDLAEKALFLLKDDRLRKKMSKKSLEIIQNYNINKSCISLEKVYYSILK